MFDDVEHDFFKIDALLKGQSVLEDKFDIEQVLVAVQNYNKKLEFLKELKRRRIESIDQQVDSIQKNIDVLHQAIAECMTQNNEKSLDFPGVGKVSVRKTKGTWQIVDDNALYEFLKSHKMEHGLVESSWKFKKKELNKILDQFLSNNNVPSSVQKDEDRTSLSISFSKNDAPINQEKSTQYKVADSQDFDKLVI
jgi:hypothetical protein